MWKHDVNIVHYHSIKYNHQCHFISLFYISFFFLNALFVSLVHKSQHFQRSHTLHNLWLKTNEVASQITLSHCVSCDFAIIFWVNKKKRKRRTVWRKYWLGRWRQPGLSVLLKELEAYNKKVVVFILCLARNWAVFDFISAVFRNHAK